MSSWLRAGCGTSFRILHRPFQATDQVVLETLIFPHIFAMAKRGVERPALAEFLAPGNRIILVLALPLAHIDRGVIDAQNDVELFAAVGAVAELVDLVRDLVATLEPGRGGMFGIFHLDLDLLVPGVAIEVTADECTVSGAVKGIGCTVGSRKSSTFLDPVLEIGQLFLIEWIAGCEKEHAVEILKRLLVHAAARFRCYRYPGHLA